MTVLIIEDEEAAARGLSNALKIQEVFPINVVGIEDSVSGSIDWLKNNPMPDIIFMDVQLSDGISFKIFEKVEVKAPIVFCTAYDQYAIQAFKVNGLDYLLKPIDNEDVVASLEKLKAIEDRALAKFDLQEIEKVFDDLKSVVSFKSRYLVKAGHKFSYIEVDKIALFFTESGIHYLKTFEDKKYQIDKPLDEIENLTNPSDFFRVNRHCIVNVKSIKSVENDYRKLLLHLSPSLSEPQFVSRQRMQNFKSWLDD